MEWNGMMCFANIASDPDAERNSFTFGQVFFHHHYVAFNVDNKSIGLAESIAQNVDPVTNNKYERCDADYPYDISYYASESNVVPNGDDIINKDNPTNPALVVNEPIDAILTVNDPADATPVESKMSILVNDMKVWSSKNPNTMIAATTGSFVAILIFVMTILIYRRIFSHRHYKRADRDETSTTSKPGIADDTELPGLI